jgi:hypothetical protein
MLEVKNSSLRKIIPIDNSEITPKNKIDSLELIKYKILEKYGFNPVIIKVDILIIQKILACFFFKYHNIKPFSLLNIIKKIKKKELFQINPEFPPYRLVEKKGVFTLAKLLLSLLIDKHEF